MSLATDASGRVVRFDINISFHFEIPPRKIEKAKKSIEFILPSQSVSYRELAKVAGFINSLYLAVGPAVRLFTRQLFFIISQRESWSGNLTFAPPLLVEELRSPLNSLHCLMVFAYVPKFPRILCMYCLEVT